MTKPIVGFRNFANKPQMRGGREKLFESNRKKDSVSNNLSVGDDLWCKKETIKQNIKNMLAIDIAQRPLEEGNPVD
jgi:hypothetical protein